MAETHDNLLESYVRTALALQGYSFEANQIAEIVLQFSRLEPIARMLMQWPLPAASDPAPVFRP